MLFNSWPFFIFFCVLLALMSLLQSRQWRKALLLIASYFFYMWWNPALISLIVISTAIDYVIGLFLARPNAKRKLLLVISLCCNLGMLGFFKYANFFQDNLIDVMSWFGQTPNWTHLNIILPVGISFYTFQTMSYTIDVYRGKLETCRSPLDFALFVAFFPQLVAGPIVRAADFLPQLRQDQPLCLDRIAILMILHGLFKKVVIADNLGFFADRVFDDVSTYPSMIVVLAVLAFSVQIYCDFSGYSEIAIGVARALGYRLPKNFDRPYFAINPSEFWRKWHISLSSWLRDYLYIPLGGNRNGRWNTYRNLMLTMLLGGLWHGASWNFVLWGLLHGLALVIHKLGFEWNLIRPGKPNRIAYFVSLFVFQYFVLLTWIAFRLPNVDTMLLTYKKFFTFVPSLNLAGIGLGNLSFFSTLMLLLFFFILHAWSNYRRDLLVVMARIPGWPLYPICTGIGIVMFIFWPMSVAPFVYFQF